jgi:hypothetical protein
MAPRTSFAEQRTDRFDLRGAELNPTAPSS